MPASPPPARLPPKKDVLLALLESTSVNVLLDPRKEGVRIPEWFKKQPQLILEIGLNMPVPIRDLEVDDEAVSCTLSFSRTPHFCFLPWNAIFALVGKDGRAMLWPDDVPPEVAAQHAEHARAEKKKRARPKLRAVGDGPTAASDAADAPPSSRPVEGAPVADAGDPTSTQAVGSTESAENPSAPGGSAEPVAKPPGLASEASEASESTDPVVAPQTAAPKQKALPPYLRVVK